jgi:hypothetical protein
LAVTFTSIGGILAMRRVTLLGIVLTLFVGCATVDPAPTATGQVFRGEVWTWDDRTNVVTLRMGTQNVRVRVSEDQMRGLRMHEIVTLRGEVAPPEEIAHVITPARPMVAVARGEAQQSQASGNVLATDPKGLVSVGTPSGALTVWSASPETVSGFSAGSPVTVRMTVQPVDMVVSDTGAATSDPAALAGGEPGEHATVTGRIVSVDPQGTITVESPRGPIVVAVTNPGAFRAGAFVQVRTTLQRAP